MCVFVVVLQSPAGRGAGHMSEVGGWETTFTEALTYVVPFMLSGEHRVITPKTPSMCDHSN